jgi:hypothetical protein
LQTSRWLKEQRAGTTKKNQLKINREKNGASSSARIFNRREICFYKIADYASKLLQNLKITSVHRRTASLAQARQAIRHGFEIKRNRGEKYHERF